jgi:hypothetical protein
MDYAEDPKDPTGTVYGYVPILYVKEWIEAHGGRLAPNMPIWTLEDTDA